MSQDAALTAAEAMDQLDPERWAATPPLERLHLLEAVRGNCKTHADELGAEDAKMKNDLMGEELCSLSTSSG
ncbi:MAG: hypothetical protein ACR2QO_27450 [Acidimicrobiales bacterium]